MHCHVWHFPEEGTLHKNSFYAEAKV